MLAAGEKTRLSRVTDLVITLDFSSALPCPLDLP